MKNIIIFTVILINIVVGCAVPQELDSVEINPSIFFVEKSDKSLTSVVLASILTPEKANVFLPEAVYANVDAIQQVLEVETPEDAINIVNSIDVLVVPIEEMKENLIGQAWRYGEKRGITLRADINEHQWKVVLVHEALHHLADLLELPSAWDHESTKLWRCNDSVEAVASELVGERFWTGYSTEDCEGTK